MLGRDTNVGYVCFESDTNSVAGVSRVFPLFFFLLAALVCITTMTRMVEEQRTQLGVLMAMGYGRGAIDVYKRQRQPHALGEIPCQNISEVAGRHHEVDLLPHPDAPRLHQIGIGPEVVYHLRGQPPDVDGVGRGLSLIHICWGM